PTLFVPLAESKGLHLDLACPEVPLPVRMDRIALNRIFSNLISNAIKFTPDGFVRVEVVPEGKEAVLRVSDTGIGMSDAFLPHLFQEFKQESEGLGRRHEGAGRGLAITKRLVEQLGGSIVVESVKGQGSTFTVRLPRHRVAGTAKKEPGARVRPGSGEASSEKASSEKASSGKAREGRLVLGFAGGLLLAL